MRQTQIENMLRAHENRIEVVETKIREYGEYMKKTPQKKNPGSRLNDDVEDKMTTISKNKPKSVGNKRITAGAIDKDVQEAIDKVKSLSEVEDASRSK